MLLQVRSRVRCPLEAAPLHQSVLPLRESEGRHSSRIPVVVHAAQGIQTQAGPRNRVMELDLVTF